MSTRERRGDGLDQLDRSDLATAHQFGLGNRIQVDRRHGFGVGHRALTSGRITRHPRLAGVRVVAAVDKFRGTVSAHQAAGAIGNACWELGFECTEIAMADGGEGTLDALGGANRTSTVSGPLGDPVEASWRLARDVAVIEMAAASGLALVGGAAGNDAIAATTAGTGELIDMALDAGAKRIVVCLGGSATTDGGLGAVRAIHAPHRIRGIELLVACDVTTVFLDAPDVFAPQKGASAAEVRLLRGRLERVAQIYQAEYGIDVRAVPGSGAAGGLAGGLAALGGRLIPGFELVADIVDLHDHIAGLAAEHLLTLGRPVGAVVGEADASAAAKIEHVSLAAEFGLERAMHEPLWCIERAATTLLRRLSAAMPGDG